MEDSKISNPSNKLVLDAVESVPVVPRYVEVRMVVGGIPPPKYEDDRDRRRYLMDCAENRIMPWTSLDFKIDGRAGGVMVPKYQQNISGVSSPERLAEATAGLLAGGRFYEVRLESSGGELFPNVKESISMFSKCGYVPHGLSMDITQYHLTGYSQGDYGDTVLSLRHNDITGGAVLNLKMGGSNTSTEQRRKLGKWFSDLATIAKLDI